MAVTLISDVVQPTLFTKYLVERTASKSNLMSSGILGQDAEFDALAGAPGRTVEMPFWQDLSGADEVLDDAAALTPAKITGITDVATICERARAWAVNDLARIRSGTQNSDVDPVDVIIDRWADYWARTHQTRLIKILDGIFAIASMAGNKLNVALPGAGTPALANTLNGSTFIDAAQKLGDSKSELTAVLMHSAVEAHLAKLDLIDFMLDQDAQTEIKLFQGKRVIVDDSLPTTTVSSNLNYFTYLFGAGAVAYGVDNSERPAEGAAANSDWYVEFARSALDGETRMITRNRTIMHPRGVKWLAASYTGKSATNTDLANLNNWLRVYEAKNVRIVQVQHNIL